MKFTAFAAFLISSSNVLAKLRYPSSSNRSYNALGDHTIVTDSNVFPYVVAVLKKYSYFSAGALLDDKWVLTTADPFYLIRESSRIIKVRLGSINYKKGGVLLPVKNVEVHPLYDVSKPLFDVALVMLAHRVRLTPTLSPVRTQNHLQEVTATHFIVTAWTPLLRVALKKARHPVSMDTIKQRRMLSVSHLHPTDPKLCADELATMEVNETECIMCLDPDLKADPCWRDTGAPVVLNGILWGIVSSWRPDDCETEPSTSFVNLVAARDIKTWIHATTSFHKWNRTEYAGGTNKEDDSDDEETNEI